MTPTSTNAAIHALQAAYSPSHFETFDSLTGLMNTLIETGIRLALESGADPVAELRALAAGHKEIMASSDFTAFRALVSRTRAAGNGYDTNHEIPGTRAGKADLCRSELARLALANAWDSQTTMQFCFRQLAVLMCAAISPGGEMDYLNEITADVQRMVATHSGIWTTQIPSRESEGEILQMDVPVLPTRFTLGANFENITAQLFAKFGVAREGDLIGILMHHACRDDGPEPASKIVAQIRQTAAGPALCKFDATEWNGSINILALRGLTGSPYFTQSMFGAIEYDTCCGEFYSAHFNGFGMVVFGEEGFDFMCDYEEDSLPPVTLLSEHARMSPVTSGAIQDAMKILRQHPALQWVGELEHRSAPLCWASDAK